MTQESQKFKTGPYKGLYYRIEKVENTPLYTEVSFFLIAYKELGVIKEKQADFNEWN